MASINTYLTRIMNAVYGEEVRGSIHDAIAAINDENVRVISDCEKAKTAAEESRKGAQSAMENAAASRTAADKAAQNASTAAQTAAKEAADGVVAQTKDILTQANQAKTDAQTARTGAEAALSSATKAQTAAAESASAAQKAEQSVDDKVAAVLAMREDLVDMTEVRDPLLDSSGNAIFDGSGRNIYGRIVLPTASDVAALTKRLNSLEAVYIQAAHEAFLDATQNAMDMAVLMTMRNDLVDAAEARDPILDSSGSPMLDSIGLGMYGRVTFSTTGAVSALEKKLNSLEVVLNTLVSKVFGLSNHALLDDKF